MRKSIWLFNVIVCMNAVNVSAQQYINDATLNYLVSVKSATNTDLSKPFQYNLYIKGGLSRTDFRSALGTESTIFDNKQQQGVILKEYSNQKLMIKLNGENWTDKTKLFSHLKFNVDGEEKKISGFSCKKATATLPNGENLVVYFAADFIMNNTNCNNCFPTIAGLVVKFERSTPNASFEYTLQHIDYDIVSSAVFELPKAGYRTLTYEEALKLNKGE